MTFSFQVKSSLPNRLGRTGVITTAHGQIKTPAFIPVGTKATFFVKIIDYNHFIIDVIVIDYIHINWG